MALLYLTQSAGLYVVYGLSTDIKPINAPINCVYVETDTKNFYVSDGTNWQFPTNEKIIKSLSDFPAPVANVITVDNNMTYLISGTVDIGPNRIVCGIKNTFRGNDRFNDKLISSTTGNLFTIDSSTTPKLSLIFDTITLQCVNGSLFNIFGGSATQLTLITTTIAPTKNGGTITGAAVSIRTSSISNAFTINGFNYVGANTSLILRDSTISNNAGTCFDFTNCTAISTISISRCFLITNATQTFMNATGISVSFVGAIALNSFAGVGTKIVGITETTPLWNFSDNNGISNTTIVTSYIHNQSIPSDTWVVNHNLGFHPNVTVVDSADTVVIGGITYNSLNQLTINFTAGFAGSAYLS